MLTKSDIINIFQETGVLQEGHFLLTSGYHSARYLQCAKVLQYPQKAEILCRSLIELVCGKNNSNSIGKVDLVIGPATGGIVIAYEVARQLGVRAIFSERIEGNIQLRRGFEIGKAEKVLVVEDVVTTGGSVQEVIDLVRSYGGNLAAVAGLVDRSDGELDFGLPAHFLLPLKVESYHPEDCPLCAGGSKPVKLGSGKLDVGSGKN